MPNAGVIAMALISATLLAGCQKDATVESTGVSVELEPMPLVTRRVGDRWQYVDEEGETHEAVVTAVDDSTYTAESTNGCSWTSELVEFAPARAWSGCGSSPDGTRAVSVRGNIWPLAVGNTVSFEAAGRNTRGDKWTNTRKCEVTETVRVSTQTGEFDTFHVQCIDNSRTRDYYVAPSVGRTVLFVNKHRRNQTVGRIELVHFEHATS